MRELLRSNDAVLINFAESVLREAGITSFLADQHISVIEGSIGAFPRRLLVGSDDWPTARRAAGRGRSRRPGSSTTGIRAREGRRRPLRSRRDDAFLGGALRILQPQEGYRAGLDAVLLAAAAPVRASRKDRVLDVGAGVGVVGLAVAQRMHRAHVTLVERDAGSRRPRAHQHRAQRLRGARARRRG